MTHIRYDASLGLFWAPILTKNNPAKNFIAMAFNPSTFSNMGGRGLAYNENTL